MTQAATEAALKGRAKAKEAKEAKAKEVAGAGGTGGSGGIAAKDPRSLVTARTLDHLFLVPLRVIPICPISKEIPPPEVTKDPAVTSSRACCVTLLQVLQVQYAEKSAAKDVSRRKSRADAAFADTRQRDSLRFRLVAPPCRWRCR